MRLDQPMHHALPMEQRLFRDGLYVTHAGWELILPGQPYPNTNHTSLYIFKWDDGRVIPAFCIGWVVAGSGEFQTRKLSYPVIKDQVFLILPGEWHRHRPDPETGWTLAWIEFNGEMPYRWWKSGDFGSEPNLLQVQDKALFALQFENLLEHVHCNPASNSSVLSLKALGVLSHLIQDTAAQMKGGGSGDLLVDRANEYIWNFSHGVLDVPAIARHVGVGRRVLERRFRSALGHGVLESIQRCRYERAARLLVETELPIKAIVCQAGFGSHEQLRRVFRKFDNSTPEEFRRQAGC